METQEPVHFRPDWLWIHNVLPATGFLFIGIAAGGWTGPDAWMLLPIVTMMSAAVAILLRTRLTIDGSSVRVVNAFRSWTVETSEVAFFEQPSRSRFETNRLVSTMRLRNGETIRVYALSAPRLFPNGRVARNLHQTIAGLNAYVARHGGGPVAPVGRLQSVDPN